MKKIILLTFMLLSSLSLSAQKKESYEYSSYAYKTGTDTHEPIKINNETFNVFYDYDSGIYTLSISFDYGDNFPDDYYDENFSCVYRGQLKDGRYVYSGVETFVRNGRIRVYDITNEVVVFTNYTLDVQLRIGRQRAYRQIKCHRVSAFLQQPKVIHISDKKQGKLKCLHYTDYINSL